MYEEFREMMCWEEKSKMYLDVEEGVHTELDTTYVSYMDKAQNILYYYEERG
jgi:hypothetical protein